MRHERPPELNGFVERLTWFCLSYKPVLLAMLLLLVLGGLYTAPFDLSLGGMPRNPVPVDAIPDIGENQQIVFTEWMGRSPQDVEDQVTYPLTAALLGVPHVKTVRSNSFFGFSSIYLIFDDAVDFYWSRARVLEKLNSLPSGALPEGVQPTLGPDATALGQIFWYTLEGRDRDGKPTGGWSPHELRRIQDWHVRYALLSAEGVSEVASIGGFSQEYHVDVDPDAMRAYGVTLEAVFNAVRMANLDVGARNLEINNVEYFIRGLGFVKEIADIENAVIAVNDHTPVYVKDVARVALGPAQRRGALDIGGADAVGGVVAARYGENPLAVIRNVEAKIAQIAPGMPTKTLSDGTLSRATIVPFYNRAGLIQETLGTLETALSYQILITIIVVLIMVAHLRSAALISTMLPLSVLLTFIAMKYTGVDANIVALAGIAIAIGAVVDVGVVLVENILQHVARKAEDEPLSHAIVRAAGEVGGATVTAVATTVVSFLPVFALQAAEGKLFKPLAFTKTFVLLAAIIVSLLFLPALTHLALKTGKNRRWLRASLHVLLPAAALAVAIWLSVPIGLGLLALAVWRALEPRLSDPWQRRLRRGASVLAALAVSLLLAAEWLPLGPERGATLNFLFVATLIGGVLLCFLLFQWSYPRVMRWALDHRPLFLCLPAVILLWGWLSWRGFDSAFGWLPDGIRQFGPVAALAERFPGLGKEFIPPLDEGSFLYMPTTMAHASIGEALDILKKQDMAFERIPEVDTVVGKLGRADTPLDPAPISMIETVINYLPEYIVAENGRRLTFRHDPNENDLFRNAAGEPVPAADGQPYRVEGAFARDEAGALIADEDGRPFRQWRPALNPGLNPGREAWPGIRDPDDIWDQIVDAGRMPGVTSAPKLQPIATRLVMLQSGMRAPMGVKIKGPDLASIEATGLQIEKFIKQLPSVRSEAVFADRIIGKPYLEIHIDRNAIARYGIMLRQAQQAIEIAIGGKTVTETVEGRERYPVRVRYPRERRHTLEDMSRVLVTAADGAQIPLSQIATIHYARGPQMIKSENAYLTSYVTFDKRPGYAEVDVVEQAIALLEAKLASGEFTLPPNVSYEFAGSFKNQVRAARTLAIILPLALALIFVILYLQFRSVASSLIIFSGIAVAWAGGFILIWLYGQPWFLDLNLFGVNGRELFQIGTVNMTVAVWVGFLALFGIATDDGVLITAYLDQSFAKRDTESVQAIREAAVAAGLRRVRPALTTTATTVIALIPVLAATGRGADLMAPMAIPTFGGMTVVVIAIFVVPLLYSWLKELEWKRGRRLAAGAQEHQRRQS